MIKNASGAGGSKRLKSSGGGATQQMRENEMTEASDEGEVI